VQAAVTPQGLWLGPVHTEARAAYTRARGRGLTPLRSLIVGTVASFKDCWAFRSKIAAFVGCSVRTVQRALTQARSEGLIGVARGKKNECPPNWKSPVACGWSHRWTVGWGKAGAAVRDAVDAARARWLVRHAAHLPARSHPTLAVAEPLKTGPRWKVAPSGREWRSMGVDEIERELAAALERKPDTPPE
jgi:hypothetical protein